MKGLVARIAISALLFLGGLALVVYSIITAISIYLLLGLGLFSLIVVLFAKPGDDFN